MMVDLIHAYVIIYTTSPLESHQQTTRINSLPIQSKPVDGVGTQIALDQPLSGKGEPVERGDFWA